MTPIHIFVASRNILFGNRSWTWNGSRSNSSYGSIHSCLSKSRYSCFSSSEFRYKSISHARIYPLLPFPFSPVTSRSSQVILDNSLS